MSGRLVALLLPLGVLAEGCGAQAAPAAQRPRGAAVIQVGPGPAVGIDDAARCGAEPVLAATPQALAEPSGGLLVAAQEDRTIVDGIGVGVRCAVRSDGSTFDVDAALAAGSDVKLALRGALDRATSSVQVSFAAGGAVFASRAPCTVDFTSADGMDIQPGRVWALVTCPQATDDAGRTCLASAEFLFEDCAQ
jgi:hypothetical protein